MQRSCEKQSYLKRYLALSCSLSGSFRLASVHCGVVILTCVIVSTHICLKSGKDSTQGEHHISETGHSSSGHTQEYLFMYLSTSIHLSTLRKAA